MTDTDRLTELRERAEGMGYRLDLYLRHRDFKWVELHQADGKWLGTLLPDEGLLAAFLTALDPEAVRVKIAGQNAPHGEITETVMWAKGHISPAPDGKEYILVLREVVR